jgi:hypothetical protein
MVARTSIVPLRFPVSIWEGGFADPGGFSQLPQAETAAFTPDPDRILTIQEGVNHFGWDGLFSLRNSFKGGIIILNITYKAFFPL